MWGGFVLDFLRCSFKENVKVFPIILNYNSARFSPRHVATNPSLNPYPGPAIVGTLDKF